MEDAPPNAITPEGMPILETDEEEMGIWVDPPPGVSQEKSQNVRGME